ncbi:hypothetical protein [Peribacillus frigoritolerans]|uniref:hypothetical protein n=1 Tax=Peribacillus frigoritolerans TaxID=450367 RepID=UPI0021615A3E|nr:hypothetical protein [Peribacillus frigoritolerans]
MSLQHILVNFKLLLVSLQHILVNFKLLLVSLVHILVNSSVTREFELVNKIQKSPRSL